MGKYKVILFNQSTYEVEDECVDDEIFDSEEDARAYIQEIYDSMPVGEEELRLCGRYNADITPGYGYNNDDLVLEVDEID